MILKLAILCLMSAPAFGIWQKGFKVRYGMDLTKIGKDYFIPMPQNYAAAISESFVNVTKPDLPDGYDNLFLMCPEDSKTVCLYYDDTGYIAGLQIAIDPNYCYEVIFDWIEAGFTEWSVTSSETTTTYWVTQQFYVSPDYLATDAATRVSERDSNYLLQEDNYYVRAFNGNLLTIPTNHNDLISSSSDYTKQSCIPTMGQHYYYKMKSDLTCSASTLSSYFPLEYNDQSIGVGFTLPANCTVPTGTKNYFEAPTKSQIKLIVPDAPDCLYEYGDSPGVMTMHTYFIKDPYYISCIW